MTTSQIVTLCCVFMCITSGRGEVSKDVGMTRFYKELGCNVKAAGSKDPVSYECPSLSQASDKTCVVKGKIYKLGDSIESEPGVCLAQCTCINPHRAKWGKVVCANVECPEHLGVPVRRQCSRTYSPDQCCATGLLCDAAAPKNATDTSKDTKVVFKSPSNPTVTCNVGGAIKTIDEGSKYYPDELPCSRCICMKGHDGTNKAPWCADIPCSVQYRFNKELQDGCAPVFIKSSRCCPLQFRCPTLKAYGEDKVIPASAGGVDAKKQIVDIKALTDAKVDTKAVNDAKVDKKPVQDKKDTKADTKLAKDTQNTKDLPKEGPQCTYGQMKLNIGDKISSPPDDPNMDCTCEIPPFVTCYKETL